MKVVLDTNVIVSATLSPAGATGQLVARVHQLSDVTIVTSEPLLAELETALSYPKTQRVHRLTSRQVSEAVERLRSQARVVRNLPDISIVANDPDDNLVVATAVAGDADLIASGDRHLLQLKSYEGIAVISPSAFLLLLPANGAN